MTSTQTNMQNKRIVFEIGEAGTGKSNVVQSVFINLLKDQNNLKIIYETNDSIGHEQGRRREKLRRR